MALTEYHVQNNETGVVHIVRTHYHSMRLEARDEAYAQGTLCGEYLACSANSLQEDLENPQDVTCMHCLFGPEYAYGPWPK